MGYQFPLIYHINDVLPHVEGRPEFVVADKGSYKVINYVMQTPDTFRPPLPSKLDGQWIWDIGDLIRRECRGIIFDSATGEVIGRRYHKFFNINERFETLVENIDFSKPHVILEKLDGSMITPFQTSDGVIHWGTKMGETDVARPVVQFIENHPEYLKAVQMMIQWKITPIFEWCSQKNRVVIDHPKDRLVLTAMRHINTGQYLGYSAMKFVNYSYFDDKIDIVRDILNGERPVLDGQNIIDAARDLVGEEGYVVRFDDGHMVKVKSDWYVAIHKAKEDLLYERNVVKLILDEKIDDVVSFLMDGDKARVLRYMAVFNSNMISEIESCARASYKFIAMNHLSRKDFALQCADAFGPLKSLIFNDFSMIGNITFDRWVNKFGMDVRALIYSKTSSNSTWERFKSDMHWNLEYYSDVPTE